MISESDQLIRIFSALLMISRVEAGSAAAQMSEINLSAAANDAAELYEPVAEDVDVILTGEIADNLNIKGNRELIGQALTNLIDNSIKYASGHDEAKIWIKLANVGDKVHLTVADNGVGIPEDKHGEVIKRFVRLDESRNMPGTGLGLALVEAVMRLHGGELKLGATDMNDKDHQGLSVTMIFPMKI